MEINQQNALNDIKSFAEMGLNAISSVSNLVEELKGSEKEIDKKSLSEIEKAKKKLQTELGKLNKISFSA